MNKVFIIALDGATFDLLEPWAQQGHLPTLSRLLDEGVSGSLRSSFPPLTGPAWSSFMTGKSAAHHSVFEFFRPQENSYQQILNSRLDIDGKSLWHILSEAGKTVGIVGIPLTYPPEPVNGFLITGLLTPPDARDFTYPRELLGEVESQLGPYRLRHDEKYRRANPYPLLKEQDEILEYNTQTALYLMRNKPWDFFMVHFYGPDRMQHEFWHLMDPQHPQHDPEERERLGDVMLDFFKKVDASIARLLAELDEETTLIIMSDHGFGPIHYFVNINTWLLQQGLIQLKPGLGTRLRHLLFRLGINYSNIGHWVLKLGFGRRAKSMGRARREELQRRIFLSLDDVDWTKTTVYSMGNFGQLYVNLKGRTPQGIIEPGEEFETVLADLSKRLKDLKDPVTGRPVVDRIFRPEDVYDGPYIENAPDLMFFTRDMVYKPMGLSDFSSSRVFEPVYGSTGHHRMNGMLLCRDPEHFQQGTQIEGARIQDLAPTILHLLDQPIPQEMDGVVLEDLFIPEVLAEHPIMYREPEENTSSSLHEGYSEQEEAKLTEMLRDLGYVA